MHSRLFPIVCMSGSISELKALQSNVFNQLRFLNLSNTENDQFTFCQNMIYCFSYDGSSH